MVTLVIEGLLDELLETLNVLLINDLREDAERVRPDDLGVALLDVLRQTRDHNEHFVFRDLQFLDEDVNEPSQELVHCRWHLKQLCHIEKHT